MVADVAAAAAADDDDGLAIGSGPIFEAVDSSALPGEQTSLSVDSRTVFAAVAAVEDGFVLKHEVVALCSLHRLRSASEPHLVLSQGRVAAKHGRLRSLCASFPVLPFAAASALSCKAH